MRSSAPVFLIDDDEAIRRSVSRLLKLSGYRVEAYPGAPVFLQTVPVQTEGVVVLDLRMTELDGFQLQETLVDSGSPMKIIFITAYANAGDRERALSNGAYGFLLKPFNGRSLIDIVEQCQTVIKIEAAARKA